MKRVLLLAVIMAAVLSFCVSAEGQNRWGIMGGANFSTAKIENISTETLTRFHAGLTYRVDLPLGFSIQPSLLYSVKGAAIDGQLQDVDFSVGYLELMPSVQWGPDLLIFRPFLDVSPFIGYGLNTKVKTEINKEAFQNSLNRLEYGVGVGVGLDIWRIQIIGRYNWNFGGLIAAKEGDGLFNEQLLKEAMQGANYGGFTLTAAILF
ncbi:MAG: PorT family protein [Bacteroidales bacterium]|nr:PorT family protein [Bacteroidales bacterium]MBR6732720.1 PorT family protein [Bacteroidales bacterium]